MPDPPPLETGRNGGREAASAEGEAAQAAEPAAPPPKSRLKSWLPLALTVVLMPVLAFVMTKFVLLPQMKRTLLASTAGAAAAAAVAPDAKESAAAAATPATDAKEGAPGNPSKKKIQVPMSKILVNVAGTMGTRYLMTSITLVGADPDFKARIDDNHDELMDLATGSLRTKSISDLEKPDFRNVMRAELITVFNNALGGPWVKEIYITEMAVQ